MSNHQTAEPVAPVKLQVQTGTLVKAISPKCSFEETEEGILFTVTDFESTKSAVIPRGPQGNKGAPGPQGDDYVLTNADKSEIAGIVRDGVVIATIEETQSYLGI